MLRMDGKVCLVTGIGSIGPGWGNGKATATLLARQGGVVFGVDIEEAAAAETKAIIEGEGGTCAIRRADMTSSEEVGAAVADCVARFGRVDVLVNNVGGSAPGGPATMTESDWDAQVDFNLKTCFLGCHHVVPVMLRQGSGVIVNLSSVAGIRQHIGRPQAAYSATKAAIVELSRSVAIQHARQGIRCNAVLPVSCTPLWSRLDWPARSPAATPRPWWRPATRRCPWATWATRGTWPTPSCFWPPTRRAISPPRRCWLTVATRP